MTQREKLIELLSIPIYPREGVDPAEVVADYLLDNGVIVPPCKVGDTVYTYGAKKVKEWKITFCGKNSEDSFKMLAADYYFKSLLEFWNWDIGKTVFFSRAEAEKALAERSDGK